MIFVCVCVKLHELLSIEMGIEVFNFPRLRFFSIFVLSFLVCLFIRFSVIESYFWRIQWIAHGCFDYWPKKCMYLPFCIVFRVQHKAHTFIIANWWICCGLVNWTVMKLDEFNFANGVIGDFSSIHSKNPDCIHTHTHTLIKCGIFAMHRTSNNESLEISSEYMHSVGKISGDLGIYTFDRRIKSLHNQFVHIQLQEQPT